MLACVTDLLRGRKAGKAECCMPREFGLGLCVASAVQVTGRIEGQLTTLDKRGAFLNSV